MNYDKGSEWRKWDLHVHTKHTNKNDQFASENFEDFCNVMFKKALEKNIAVIGITDYFSIDNYEKVLDFVENINSNEAFTAAEHEKIKQVTLMPNIELRMLPSTDKARLINIHCIFNPEYVSKLSNDFFSTLECSSGGRKHKMNKDGLINFGKELGETDDELAYKKGLNNFVVSHSDLQKLLDENYELKNNTIVIVSNSNQDGASAIQKHYDLFENEQHSSLDGVRQAIYKLSNMIFSSNDNDRKFFLGLKGVLKEDVIKKCGSLKPCIHGSDAHKEEDLFNPKNNKFCWIKANPTFEGLKQILFEPSRVYIGENKPQPALHKLEEVQLKFDTNTTWENDSFCFNDFHKAIKFSPYLTCVIGGRGSGKSTLLNLIAEKIGKQNIDFFAKLKPKDVSTKVVFTPEVVDNIEYLAQNEIEEFAKDSRKFTNAIYDRLNKKSDGNLKVLENKITDELNIFDNQIELLKTRVNKHIEINQEYQELKKFENIVKTLTDIKYMENKDSLQSVQKKIIEIENSRKKYEDIFLSLKEIQTTYEQFSNPKNNYEIYFNELHNDLVELFAKYSTKDYTEDKKTLSELNSQKDTYIEEIKKYLVEQGMNDENIKDAQAASTNIESIKEKIKRLKHDIVQIQKIKNKFNSQSLDSDIDDFRVKMDEQLKIINDGFLKIANENSTEVKIIKVEYQLNNDIADVILDEFIAELDTEFIKKIEKSTFKNYMKDVGLYDVIGINKGSEFIQKISPRQSQTYQALQEIFSIEQNFQIYKLLIQKNLKDVKTNKELKVFYDDKALDNSSFGQRCTAAIVVLLSLGNNPVIIDEPEAHLDSSLIANYLVELIKEQKQNRQIIFATHNANFVLNADAELIIKLENTDGFTKSVSFTIEDINYREDLLKLEGGREAFKKREQKYNV